MLGVSSRHNRGYSFLENLLVLVLFLLLHALAEKGSRHCVVHEGPALEVVGVCFGAGFSFCGRVLGCLVWCALYYVLGVGCQVGLWGRYLLS